MRPSNSIIKKIVFTILLLTFAMSELFAAGITFSSSTTFGKVNVGSTQSITFTLKNTTTSTVRLDSYWFTTGSNYSVTGGTCGFDQVTGFKLAKNATCTVIVKFAPTSVMKYPDTYTVGYFLGTGWTWKENYLALNGEGISSTVATPTPTPIQSSPTPTPTPILTSPTPTPVAATTGWLHVEGNKILDDQLKQVILKGVNIADTEVLDVKTWERPGVSARSIASLASDQYFAKVVRIPVLPGNSSYPNEGFFSATNGKDVYFKNHLEPVVKDLTAKGVYVIIDLHYVSDYSTLYPKVQEFWTYMAPKFKDNPYVIYEIFNEPILPDDWNTWKTTIAQPATDLIRSYAPNNLILIGGPYWSSHMAGAATNPVAGTNLVYVGHIYSNQTPSMWASRYEPVISKYPMFITEWGFETGGTEGGDINFGTQLEAWMKQYNLSWTVWSFDILWGPRMFNSDWTLRPSPGGEGEFVRDLLILNNQTN